MSNNGGEFTFTEGGSRPVAVLRPESQLVKIGRFVHLNGRGSSDPDNLPLVYTWSVESCPLTSKVSSKDFIQIGDPSEVVFLPDVPGDYTLGLVVGNGHLDSEKVICSAEISFGEIPYGAGEAPDASWLWSTLSNFWSIVANRGALETIFSATIQMVAAQWLRLQQNSFCKAIRDTPDYLQRRWLAYQTRLDLNPDRHTLYMGGQAAGFSCGTGFIGFRGSIDTVAGQRSVTISSGAVSPKAVGHTLVVLDGANAGRYTVQSLLKSGSGYTLDPAPTATTTCSFRIECLPSDRTNVFYVPLSEADLTLLRNPAGRLICVEGRGYRILRTFKDMVSFEVPVSGVVVENNELPPGLGALDWRVPFVLAGDQIDFEGQGVAEGDVLEFDITSAQSGTFDRSSVFRCRVVGVSGNRLGFVPTLEDVTGVSAPEPSTLELETLADELQISHEDPDNEMEELISIIRGEDFRSRYMFSGLVQDSDLEVTNSRFFQIGAAHLLRTSAIQVDSDLRSVPYLQVEIKDPTTSYRENADYYLEGPDDIRGIGTTYQNSGRLVCSGALFLKRRILPGDTLRLLDGDDHGDYVIFRVSDDETLLVYPSFEFWDDKVQFQILRKNRERMLRFNPGLFDTVPAERLWADVSFFTSDAVTEANFGAYLQFMRMDHSELPTGAPYKDVVTTLLHAAATGPTPENLMRGAQGILGLPMAAHRGRVVEVEEDYQINARTGSPELGRIVLQDMDEAASWEQALAAPDSLIADRYRTYHYPAIREGREDFTGLATNPETGERYREGDTVERFSLLSRGVEYADYLSDPDFWRSHAEFIGQDDIWEVRKFHTFRLRVLFELVGPGQFPELDSFLDRVRPAYTYYDLAALVRLTDTVQVTDDVNLGFTYFFGDNPALGFQTALSYDYPNAHGERTFHYGKYALETRVWKHGKDLLLSPGGHATTGLDLSHARAGDHLVIFGNGRYLLSEDPTEGVEGWSCTVEQLQEDWPETCPDPTDWEENGPFRFTVQRELKNPISWGEDAFVGDPAPEGGTRVTLRSSTPFWDNVVPGDYIVFSDIVGTYGYHKILRMDPENLTIDVDRDPTMGSWTWHVHRPSLFEDYTAEIGSVSGNIILFAVPGTNFLDAVVWEGLTLELLDADGLVLSTHKIIKVVNRAQLKVAPAPTLEATQARVVRGDGHPTYDMLWKRVPSEEVVVSRLSRESAALPPGEPGEGDDTVTASGVDDSFTSAGAVFVDLKVLPGDEISVTGGSNEGTSFMILRVTSDKVYVAEDIATDASPRVYRLSRRSR